MKITCYLSTNTREQEIGKALQRGCDRAGDDVQLKLRSDFWIATEEAGEPMVDPDADVICVIGVKSKTMFDACKKQGKLPLLIDKGYFGRGEMYRMSLGAYQPPYIEQIIADMWDDPVMFHSRLSACGLSPKPRRRGGTGIMYVGSSQKYCNFHGLGDNNEYSRKVITQLSGFWPHPIIYRPKPSWWAKFRAGERRDPLTDIPRVEFSKPETQFAKELMRCHAVVTHGSNGAAEALAMGIPCIMLSPEGASPVWSLCEHDLAKAQEPFFPRVEDTLRIMSAMAWTQFSISEMETGFAWRNLKHWHQELEAKAKRASGANERATL